LDRVATSARAGRIARRRTVSIGWGLGITRLPVGSLPIGEYRLPPSSPSSFWLFGGGGGWLYWSAHRTAAAHYATQKIEVAQSSAP